MAEKRAKKIEIPLPSNLLDNPAMIQGERNDETHKKHRTQAKQRARRREWNGKWSEEKERICCTCLVNFCFQYFSISHHAHIHNWCDVMRCYWHLSINTCFRCFTVHAIVLVRHTMRSSDKSTSSYFSCTFSLSPSLSVSSSSLPCLLEHKGKMGKTRKKQ